MKIYAYGTVTECPYCAGHWRRGYDEKPTMETHEKPVLVDGEFRCAASFLPGEHTVTPLGPHMTRKCPRCKGKWIERLGPLLGGAKPPPAESAGDRAKRRFDEMAGNADLKQRLEALRTRLINVREHTTGMVQDAVGGIINDDVKGLQELAAEKPPDISADAAAALLGMIGRLTCRLLEVRDRSNMYGPNACWPTKRMSEIVDINVEELRTYIASWAEDTTQ